MSTFKCTYCNKEYDFPEDMARCVITCSEKIKREEEQKRIAYVEKEREVRVKEAQEAFDNLLEIVVNYEKDYNKTLSLKINNPTINSSYQDVLKFVSSIW